MVLVPQARQFPERVVGSGTPSLSLSCGKLACTLHAVGCPFFRARASGVGKSAAEPATGRLCGIRVPRHPRMGGGLWYPHGAAITRGSAAETGSPLQELTRAGFQLRDDSPRYVQRAVQVSCTVIAASPG